MYIYTCIVCSGKVCVYIFFLRKVCIEDKYVYSYFSYGEKQLASTSRLPHVLKVLMQFKTADTFDLHYYVKVVEMNCLLLCLMSQSNQLLHE